MFESNETLSKKDIEAGEIFAPKFDAAGLIPAIVQDHETKSILMVAYMNKQALQKSLATKQAHFWSRSRGELWHKGATSGNIQHIVEIQIDCDQDCLLVFVRPDGDKKACHTGRVSCFYRKLDETDPKKLLSI